VSFTWLGGSREPGSGDRTFVRSDSSGSFWLTPIQPDARAQLQRVLDGTLATGDNAAVALERDGARLAAEALTSGPHECRCVCAGAACPRLRLARKGPDGSPRPALALAPAAATSLLDAPPSTSLVMQATGEEREAATSATGATHSIPESEWCWKRLVPGD